MPKFNLDEDKSLFSPIEFIIDGKTFTLSNLKEKSFKKVGETKDVFVQFAILTGEKLRKVKKLNMFKISKALELIMKEIMKQLPPELKLQIESDMVKEKGISKEEEEKNG